MGKVNKFWKLNNTLLNKNWIMGEIKNLKILITQLKQKQNIPNLWCTIKAFLRGKFIALSDYTR